MDDIKKHKDEMISGVYTGAITPTHLHKGVYHETAKHLISGMNTGYGKIDLSIQYDSPDVQMLNELKTNIYMFSAAKTFQQTLAMTDKLYDGDKIVSFDDFKEAVGEIFDDFNETYLEAEYNTAIGMARSASIWTDIQSKKETLPYMRYIAVMDSHTCDICAPLDGITLPVDDPFWDTNMPLNHFNCECTVEQLEEATETEEEDVTDAVDKSEETKNPLFNMNPGKDKAIFKDTGRYKHPYFDIPAKYKELAQKNFNLPIE